MASKVWVLIALFVLIIGLGCKSIVRQQEQASDVYAVSDGRLTLGMVGIEKDNAVAYRLLVCQKQGTFSLAALQDSNRCRVALLSDNGEEVIFLPDLLRRGFMAKEFGNFKGSVVGILVIIPAAVVGSLSGSWTIVKRVGKVSKEGETAFEILKRQIVEDERFGEKSYHFYERFAKRASKAPKLVAVEDGLINQATEKYFTTNARAMNIQRNAAELSVINKWRKFVADLKGQSQEKTNEAIRYLEDEITKLEKEIDDSKPNVNIDEIKKRMYNTFTTTEEKQTLLQNAETYYTKTNQLARKTAELDTMEDTLLELREEGVVGASLLLDGFLNRLKIELSKSSVETTHSIAEFNYFIRTMVGTATGVAAGSLAILHKSIWGYHDRMVGKYWHQIFITDDDLRQTKEIKNMHVLLESLAKYFGYRVNPRALEL